MLRAALIDAGGVARNVIVWSEGDDAPVGLMPVILADTDHVSTGWVYQSDGSWIDPTYREPTPEETQAAISSAIQMHVRSVACARGYDSAESCASYVSSTNAAWADEGRIFVAWRDTVWAYALTTLAAAKAGTEAAPTAENIIASLPVIVWPV